MTPLPFSGLSLIVHLGVIGIAYVAGLFGIERKRKKGWETEGALPVVLGAVKPIISIAILGFIGTITAGFILTAITTGITSGANEPQRVFIKELFLDVKEGNLIQFFESHMEYQKTSPVFPTTPASFSLS